MIRTRPHSQTPSEMTSQPQTREIVVAYRPSSLLLMDTSSKTPLFNIAMSREIPQIQMQSLIHSPHSAGSPASTASFSVLSTTVTLSLNSKTILLHWAGGLSRTYYYDSPIASTTLWWKPAGMISGDWVCVDKKGEVLVRFRNSMWQTKELGTFVVEGDLGDGEAEMELLGEICFTGCAVLGMMQSLWLGLKVLIG